MSSDISKSSILARLSREENKDKFVEKDVENTICGEKGRFIRSAAARVTPR
jgi:hypothetical protein